MHKIMFSEEQIEEMKAMYEKGDGLKPIAAKFYSSTEVIRRTLKQSGVEMRHEAGAKKKILSNDEFRKIKTMYEMGVTLKKISEEIGVSTFKIKETLVKNDITERPRASKQNECHKAEDLNDIQWVDCNRNGRRCAYRAGSTAPNLCDYILIEGHSRGCDARRCTKFVLKANSRRKKVKV